MRRSLYAGCLGCLLCLMPTSSANAQTLDLTYNLTRAFDIPSEQWMGFHVPGVEFQAKGFTLGTVLFLDATTAEKSEVDVNVKFDHGVEWNSKLTFSLRASSIRYFMNFSDPLKQRKTDWSAGAEIRYRIFDR